MGLFRKSALANAMAVGKNKRLTKGRKWKGKKIVDPFTKKDWYDIKAPSLFTNKLAGKTPVTRTQGTKIASDGLKGRVFEICLADLNKDEDQAYQDQTLLRRSAGKVLPHQLPWNGLHGRQIAFVGSQVADPCRSKRRCQDHRRIRAPNVLHCVHQETTKPNPEDVILLLSAGETD